MSWRNLLASIFGDFCGGSNCPGVTPTIPAKKADAREFQDCYCARIGLCWAPSWPKPNNAVTSRKVAGFFSVSETGVLNGRRARLSVAIARRDHHEATLGN